MSRKEFDLIQVASWVVGAAVAVAGAASWAYGTFETKDGSGVLRDINNQRLERMENKIDYLIGLSVSRKGK